MWEQAKWENTYRSGVSKMISLNSYRIIPKILGIVKILPWRMILTVFLALSALMYGFTGWETTKRLLSQSTQSEADRMVEDMIRSNPSVAAEIENLKNDYGSVALASKMSLDSKAIQNTMMIDYINQGLVPPELPLVKLVSNTYLRDDAQDMNTFLNEYLMPLRILSDGDTRDQIVSALERVSESPADWVIVSKHPFGLLSWQATRNTPNLWSFYAKNYDWLTEALFITFSMESVMYDDQYENTRQIDNYARILQLLTVAQEYQNILSELHKDYSDEQLAFSLTLLELHGESIKIAHDRYKIPTQEIIEILYSNPFFLTDHIQANQNTAEYNASELNNLWTNHRSVWDNAKVVPQALELYRDAPQYADIVLEKYGNNPSFLLQLYETYGDEDVNGHSKTMAFVAESIVRHEDLAVHTLFKFKDNNDFKELLIQPEIGSRIVPYAARFDSDGLLKLKDDHRWINRYFDKDGNAIDDERWWEAIPGGSIVKIMKNKIDGVPCTWGELGWAVFDAADISLMIFTVGTSKAITSGVKGSIKAGGRGLAKGARAGDKFGDALRLLKGSSTTERTVMRGRAVRGSLMAQQSQVSLYQRIIRSSDELADMTRVWANPKYKNVWRGVGITLAFAKVYAKRDTLGNMPQQMGELLGKAGVVALQSSGELLANSMQQFLPKFTSPIYAIIIHIAIILILSSLAYAAWMKMKPTRVRYI
jgi:hypothetical protein